MRDTYSSGSDVALEKILPEDQLLRRSNHNYISQHHFKIKVGAFMISQMMIMSIKTRLSQSPTEKNG